VQTISTAGETDEGDYMSENGPFKSGTEEDKIKKLREELAQQPIK